MFCGNNKFEEKNQYANNHNINKRQIEGLSHDFQFILLEKLFKVLMTEIVDCTQ